MNTVKWCITVVQGHRNWYESKVHMQLSIGLPFKKRMILRVFVYTGYRLVTDGQTDGWTHREMAPAMLKSCPNIAEYDKNGSQFYSYNKTA